jgi:hypothetical protein
MKRSCRIDQLNLSRICYEVLWPLVPMSLVLSCVRPGWPEHLQSARAIKVEGLYIVGTYICFTPRP